MKRILTTFLASFFLMNVPLILHSQNQTRTVEFPSYKIQEQGKNGNLHLISVEATDNETRCYFEYDYYKPKGRKTRVSISVSTGIYYKENEKEHRLELQKAVGIPMSDQKKKLKLSGSGRLKFELVFPEIPSYIDSIDFIEDPNSSWNLIDIDLSKSNSEEDQDISSFKRDSVFEQAKFEGGSPNDFAKWVNSRLVYPKNAKKLGVQGTVKVLIMLSNNGKVKAKLLESSGNKELDDEALRVVRSSPDWTPAKYKGYHIAMNYRFPVIFQLFKKH